MGTYEVHRYLTGDPMPKQISKDKRQISVVLTIDQIKRLDGRAAELGTNRTALISEAVDALLDGHASDGSSADSAKIETIIAKLDGLAANQAAIKADQVTHMTLLADAIRNQPIAVQQQELPAPEVTDADVQAYIRARRPDIELDVFGDPVTPKRKGLVSRILGRG